MQSRFVACTCAMQKSVALTTYEYTTSLNSGKPRNIPTRRRQFLISWVAVLESVPDLDLLAYLPELLDGLMALLSDPNR